MFLQSGYTKNSDLADSDLDARELEEDMKLAARTLTFFGTYRTIICFNVLIVSIIVDPTKTVSRFRYEDTV